MIAATAPDDAAYTDETWAYAGARLDAGKRTHAWADPADGKLRYWADRGSYVVGARYRLRIDRTREGVYRRGGPQFLGGDGASPGDTAAWTIEDEKTEHYLARQRAERKAKARGSVIDQAAAGVCVLAAGVKTYTELETLMAAVRRRMIDAWDAGK